MLLSKAPPILLISSKPAESQPNAVSYMSLPKLLPEVFVNTFASNSVPLKPPPTFVLTRPNVLTNAPLLTAANIFVASCV